MNKEEIEEIETLEIDFKDTDELELALEVSSKKAIYLIDDLIKHLFELKQENKKQSEKIKEVLTLLENFNADQVCTHTTRLSNEIEKTLRGVSE